MMEKRHGSEAIVSYHAKADVVEQARIKYQAQADNGDFQIIYRFGDGTLIDDDLNITHEDISVSGFTNKIVLPTINPFADMT